MSATAEPYPTAVSSAPDWRGAVADCVRALGDVGETILTGNTSKLIANLPKRP